MPRSCLLKHVTEGKIEERTEVTGRGEEDVTSYWMTLRERQVISNWKKNTRSHSVDTLLWKRISRCLETYYRMNDETAEIMKKLIVSQ